MYCSYVSDVTMVVPGSRPGTQWRVFVENTSFRFYVDYDCDVVKTETLFVRGGDRLWGTPGGLRWGPGPCLIRESFTTYLPDLRTVWRVLVSPSPTTRTVAPFFWSLNTVCLRYLRILWTYRPTPLVWLYGQRPTSMDFYQVRSLDSNFSEKRSHMNTYSTRNLYISPLTTPTYSTHSSSSSSSFLFPFFSMDFIVNVSSFTRHYIGPRATTSSSPLSIKSHPIPLVLPKDLLLHG